MYDEFVLRTRFESAGFREVSWRKFTESLIPDFIELDIPARAHETVHVEDRKP